MECWFSILNIYDIVFGIFKINSVMRKCSNVVFFLSFCCCYLEFFLYTHSILLFCSLYIYVCKKKGKLKMYSQKIFPMNFHITCYNKNKFSYRELFFSMWLIFLREKQIMGQWCYRCLLILHEIFLYLN